MRAFIYDMICPACKFFVKSELDDLGIEYKSIELGFVEFPGKVSEKQLKMLATALKPYGLELVNKNLILKKINLAISDFVENPELEAKFKLSEFLSQKLHKSYTFLNLLFKSETDTTLDKYLKAKKIERAIELMVNYKLNLTEITYQLNYASISNLSSQFKTITGMTPLKYRSYLMQNQEFLYQKR